MTPINAQSTSESSRFAAGPSAVRLAADTVVCGSCGCRLTNREAAGGAGPAARNWYHFEGQPGRDARGCSVGCVDSAHRLG